MADLTAASEYMGRLLTSNSRSDNFHTASSAHKLASVPQGPNSDGSVNMNKTYNTPMASIKRPDSSLQMKAKAAGKPRPPGSSKVSSDGTKKYYN